MAPCLLFPELRQIAASLFPQRVQPLAPSRRLRLALANTPADPPRQYAHAPVGVNLRRK